MSLPLVDPDAVKVRLRPTSRSFHWSIFF